jgi:rhamnose utilization protein RhaD (predicted bifunctional aldolase and dehydrogenase)
MKNRWNEVDELACISYYREHYVDVEEEILRQAYATTLLGADKELTMHGGGNTSIKVNMVDSTGKENRALYVKATGTPLDAFTPEHFVAMDLEFLEGLKSSGGIGDADMAREFRGHQMVRTDKLPSIESLMHAFIPARVVDHSHPEALLKIANRVGGDALLEECFGGDLAVSPYARMGYELASAVSAAAARNPGGRGVAIAHHGLVVWGDGARDAYHLTIDIVNRAENFLAAMPQKPIRRGPETPVGVSIENYKKIAPAVANAVRTCVSRRRGEVYPPHRLEWIDGNGVNQHTHGSFLALLNAADVMELINSPDGKRIICDPPMTPDYPMPRRILPLWLDVDSDTGFGAVSSTVSAAVDKFADDYKAYLEAHGVTTPPLIDIMPRAMVIPRVGMVCLGIDKAAAKSTADYLRQAFSIRRAIFESGGAYRALEEEYLFDMQYRGYQGGGR